jgi:peptide/nickel transport system substrate-binding protein
MRQDRSTRRRRLALAVSGILVAALVAGCGGTSSSGNTSGSDEVDSSANLRIGYPVGQSLDPHQAPEPAQLLIGTWPVYDRLIQVSAKATYEPMLATEWEFSPDGKALTLTLREGVTFSDGTPFDASVVKANLENYMAADGTALQGGVADIAKVEVVDATTVKLDLKKPSTTVLSGLSSTLGGIMISPKSLAGKDLSTHPVGTGAYVIDSFQPGQSVTYKRRTDEGGIWDAKTGKPATVSISTFGNVDALSNALKGGQADLIVWSSETSAFKSDIDSGRLTHTVMDGVLNMVGLNFNLKKKPYDDPAVRKAINYAIDRNAIVEAFMPDTSPQVQPWPDGLPGFDEAREDTYTFDPAKAKQILKDAGYANGVDGGELLVAATGRFSEAAEAIQANLADVGIKVVLRNTDVYALITQWSKGEGAAQLMYMSLPSIDPYSWLQRLFVNPVWSPSGADPEVVKLTAGLDDPAMSDEDRAARVGEIIDHTTEIARYATLWQGVGGFMASSKVKNLDDLASVNGGVADFRDVYLTK